MNSLPFSRSWWLWVRYFSQHRSSAWTEWSTFLESSCTTCEPTWSPLHTVIAEEWRKWKRTNTSGNQNGSKCCHTNSWFCTIVTADLWLKPTKTFNANEYWKQWYYYLWGTGICLFCMYYEYEFTPSQTFHFPFERYWNSLWNFDLYAPFSKEIIF